MRSMPSMLIDRTPAKAVCLCSPAPAIARRSSGPEIDVLRLRAPGGADEDEESPYYHQDEHRVLEGHEVGEPGLVEDEERGQDDREAVSQTESGSSDAGLKPFVDVHRAERPWRDDQDRRDGRQQDDLRQTARSGAQKQVIEECPQGGRDSARQHQVTAASDALADRTADYIGDAEHEVSDDQGGGEINTSHFYLRSEQAGHDGQRRVQRQPEPCHHYEDLQEVPQVLASEQRLDRRCA